MRQGQKELTAEISTFKQIKNHQIESHLERRRIRRATLGDMMADCSQFLKSWLLVKIIDERQERLADLKESMEPLRVSELLVP